MSETARKTVNVTHRRFSKSIKKQQTRTGDRRNEALERFANVVIRAIRVRFAASAFTRDDLLTMVSRMRLSNNEDDWAGDTAGVNDTSTSTRYYKVCAAVQYLIASEQLVEIDWLRVCLPERYGQLSQAVPPQVAYLPTIRRIVQEFPGGSKLDAMAVVDRWTSDQHLPENVKRMTTRGVLPALVREGILQRGEFRNEFRVKV